MRIERAVLTLILIAFAAAAAHGMRADLPYSRFATEEEQVFYALKFGSGDLNPHYFLHPPLFAYALFAVYGVVFVAGRLGGWFHGPADLERLFFTDATFFFLIARILVLSLALVGLLVFYRLAKRLYGRESIALVATGFLGASTLHVGAAHYANTDIPMMVLALAAFHLIVSVLRKGRIAHYALAGLCIGLATATKYNAAWLGVALVIAHALRGESGGWRSRLQPAAWRPLAIGLLMIPLGFVIGCPFALFDPRTFLASFAKLRWELMTPEYHFASYRAQGPGHLFVLTDVLPSTMGMPLTVMCLFGLLVALRKCKPEDLLLAGFLLTFVGYLGTWDIIKPRYFIYALPLAFILAARACVLLVDGLASQRARAVALAAAYAALVIAPWHQTLEFNRLVAQTPVPVQVRAWVEQHVPQGTGIALSAGIPLVPNEASIARQLEETRTKGLGKGIRLQRLSRHLSSIPATYDLWYLPYPWREDFDPSDFDLAQHRRAGVRYVLLTQEADEYLADPIRYRAQAAYVESVRRSGHLVREFRQSSPVVDPGLGSQEAVMIYELAPS